MSMKLAQEGVILSTDEQGNPQIQRIDEAELFAYENSLEYVEQLKSDDEAVQIVRNLVIDSYIEPISNLTESELITEAKELNIL